MVLDCCDYAFPTKTLQMLSKYFSPKAEPHDIVGFHDWRLQLRRIDPRTNRSARLMSSHLSSATEDTISTPAAVAYEAAIAKLRASAVTGDTSLAHMPIARHSAAGRASCSPEREVTCPFNPSHRLPHQSLKHHLTKCPDRPAETK